MNYTKCLQYLLCTLYEFRIFFFIVSVTYIFVSISAGCEGHLFIKLGKTNVDIESKHDS